MGLLAALVALVPLGMAPARAAGTVTVTTCDESNLRSAITSAGAGGTITFGCSGTITLAATITIDSSLSGLTVDGGGQAVTLSGGFTATVTGVQVLSVNSGVSLTLSHVTIANGNSGNNLGGGGILNDGTLSVSNSIFRGNAGEEGGGIHNHGMLSVSNSTFTGNGSGDGGGIRSDGTLRVSNSIFSGNVASGGGGISSEGMLSVSNSTFAGNGAFDGGGILAAGTVSVSNSTFSGNGGNGLVSTSDLDGGGIYFAGGTLSITNSTFSGNIADGGAGSGQGGGLFNDRGSVSVANSTFSGNRAGTAGGGMATIDGGRTTLVNAIVVDSPSGGNCAMVSGTIGDNGGNVEDDTTCGFSAANHSLANTNPQLLALADNGGPTQTIALAPTSPAIGLGLAATCLSTGPTGVNNLDQRGQPRHADTRGACDSGAYDTGGPTDTTPPVLNLPGIITIDATSPVGAVVTYAVSASDPDNAPSQLTITCTPTSGSAFPIGTTTVTCRASDPAGNTATGSFPVVVQGAAAQLNDLTSLVGGMGSHGGCGPAWRLSCRRSAPPSRRVAPPRRAARWAPLATRCGPRQARGSPRHRPGNCSPPGRRYRR